MEKKKKKDKPADDALHAEEAELPAPTTTEPATFKGKVNKYCFIHLDKSLREAWDITRGTEQPVTIEISAENALLIKKA